MFLSTAPGVVPWRDSRVKVFLTIALLAEWEPRPRGHAGTVGAVPQRRNSSRALKCASFKKKELSAHSPCGVKGPGILLTSGVSQAYPEPTFT